MMLGIKWPPRASRASQTVIKQGKGGSFSPGVGASYVGIIQRRTRRSVILSSQHRRSAFRVIKAPFATLQGVDLMDTFKIPRLSRLLELAHLQRLAPSSHMPFKEEAQIKTVSDVSTVSEDDVRQELVAGRTDKRKARS